MAPHVPGAAPGEGHDPGAAADETQGSTRLIGRVRAPAIHVMSWNIRRPVPAVLARPADRWTVREDRLRSLLAAEQPTVLGAQEVLAEQSAVMLEALGAGYAVVGRGRAADGSGEASPIVYDTDRLDLLDWDQAALSDQPTRAGSVSWGNVFPRIVVSATFRDRETSRRFLAVNTHLDPFSSCSRRRSARAILDLVSSRGLPAVLTGDLNAGPSSAAVRELLSRGTLADSWDRARRRVSEEWGTYAGYRTPRASGPRIDWILASPAFTVSRAGVNPLRHGGGWASDHLPVHAVMSLDRGGGT